MAFRTDRAAYKFTKTPDGFLQGTAVVSRAGVFSYQNEDGSIRKELRHPDDVLSAESLETLKLKPVTDEHPTQMVTPETVKELQVGMTGETVTVDGQNIVATFVVNDASAIEAIESGRKREVSLGYMVDLVEESGEYNGERYDYRQTAVRYNHLALVPRGRAGNARINMDGAAVQLVTGGDEMAEKAMKTVRLDGIDYEAAPEVVNRLDALEAQVKQGETALQEGKAQAEKAQAALDELKKRNDALLEQLKPEALDVIVNERVALVEAVRKVAGAEAKLDGLSAKEMQLFAIKAKHADFNAEGRSDEYIAARFDAIVEAGNFDAVAKQAGNLGASTEKRELDQATYFNNRKKQGDNQ